MAEPASNLFLLDAKAGRPLRVLITRPDEQAAETARAVVAAGGEPLLFPCLHSAPPADPSAFLHTLARLHEFTAVVVSSANAAKALAAGLRQLGGHSATALQDVLVAAVGPQTAAALAQHGILVHVTAAQQSSAEGLAAAVAAALQDRAQRLPGARIFFPRAAEASDTLSSLLGSAGAQVTEAVAYQMVAASAQSLAPLGPLLRHGHVDLAPFGSPRTARIACTALKEPAPKLGAFGGFGDFFDRKRIVVGAIGPSTAAALHALGVPADVVAKSAEFPTLLRLMSAYRQNLTQFQ